MYDNLDLVKNERSGLLEGVHPYYKVPVVFQRGISSLRFNGQKTAVHTVPLSNGLTLDFFSRLEAHDELLVVFHGAVSENRLFYPRFERQQSMRRTKQGVIHFADPTLQLSEDQSMRLSWYLGGPSWDPTYDIARVIRRAMGKTGSKYVAFIGGSGGGFMAMRMATLFPQSLAYVQDPQANVGAYSTRIVRRYFETAWPNWVMGRVLDAFPERFNMALHYPRLQPDCYLYYWQNSTDVEHVPLQFQPFTKAIMGKELNSSMEFEQFNFVLQEGERKGHGMITETEFKLNLDAAIKWWRLSRNQRL